MNLPRLDSQVWDEHWQRFSELRSSIIDSHAHVVQEFYGDDQQEVIARSIASRVVQLINPAVTPDDIPELLSLAQRYPYIHVGAGMHPHEAKSWNRDAARLVRDAAAQEKVVAIGECGLDFYYNNSDREAQLQAFKEQIHIALEYEKPIIVHCRDAWDEALSLLETEGEGNVRGVFHCFTGGPEILPRIAKLDFYVSFSGIVTFGNAKDIQAAAKLVANDRFLVETDCPFLAPQKVRGKRNEPACVWFVAEKLAELRATTGDAICSDSVANTRRLFAL